MCQKLEGFYNLIEELLDQGKRMEYHVETKKTTGLEARCYKFQGRKLRVRPLIIVLSEVTGYRLDWPNQIVPDKKVNIHL